MKLPSLTLIALLGLPAAASGSVVSLGSALAESCYRSADERNASREAIDSCDRALAGEALTAKDRVATHVNRGSIYLVRGNVALANADFDAALAMDPNQPEAWLNKAIGHARFGKSIDALPFVEKALALKTRRPALAYFVRAMALEDSGNIRGAYRDLKRAQALDPKWKEPQIELRRFRVLG